ncbi:CRISPR-associated endonuclease Cas2 [Coleofasciculus sp. G2-EDA-02]|uniref:CRISPR-associated endonuclease Cas2 n=1 Tax=unclassified Coleofasciculus TaxID=2692782 RepID=UPI0032FF3C00
MLFYVIAYDIPDDKRRKKIADLLEGYGQRVQYSVFELVLSQKKFNELKSRLQKKVKLSEDSLRFYPLSRHTLAQVETWGIGPTVAQAPGSFVV